MINSNYFISKEIIIEKIDEICEQGGIDIDLQTNTDRHTKYTKLSQKDKLRLKDDLLIDIFYNVSFNYAYKVFEEEEMFDDLYSVPQTIH